MSDLTPEQRIEVRYVAGDGTTVDEEPVAADRVSVQMWDGGRAIVKLYRGGRVVETIIYRQADRIRRVIEQ